jgi:glycosyltransferase involved in cell wall biosynthesis
MKILIFSRTYHPRQDGVQKVTQYHAEFLVSKGHQVTVVTFSTDNLIHFEFINGVSVYRFKVRKRFFFFYFGEVRKCIDFVLNKLKLSDIFVLVSEFDIFSRSINRVKCKKVFYLHGKVDNYFNLKYVKYGLFVSVKMFIRILLKNMYYFFHKKKFKLFDLIVNINENDHVVQKLNGYKVNKIETILNCPDNDFFNVTNNTKKTTFLYLSNYATWKNQEFALKAFYLSKQNNYSLTFVGSHKTKYLMRLIEINKNYERYYGNRNVNFQVGLTKNQIYEKFSQSISLLLTSYTETFSLVLVEALASGIPFISTNVGVANKLPYGFVINSVEEMSYWIDFLSRNPNIALEYGNSGRNYSKRYFNKALQQEKFEKLLSNLL